VLFKNEYNNVTLNIVFFNYYDFIDLIFDYIKLYSTNIIKDDNRFHIIINLISPLDLILKNISFENVNKIIIIYENNDIESFTIRIFMNNLSIKINNISEYDEELKDKEETNILINKDNISKYDAVLKNKEKTDIHIDYEYLFIDREPNIFDIMFTDQEIFKQCKLVQPDIIHNKYIVELFNIIKRKI
jgi:hypothetical protein